MKTTKLFLSIALVALTVSTFGKYTEAENIEFENELLIESWMASPFETDDEELVLENWMTVPFQTEGNDLALENWMSTPFQTLSLENELAMESWMTTPFEMGVELDALAMESWMTTPFAATDDNCTEGLMAAASN